MLQNPTVYVHNAWVFCDCWTSQEKSGICEKFLAVLIFNCGALRNLVRILSEKTTRAIKENWEYGLQK